MSDPVLKQTRRAITLAGEVRWEVVSRISDRGDLPFRELFVLTIVDAADPKKDILGRVATPYDLRVIENVHYVKVSADDIVTISNDTFARIANVAELTGLPRDRTVAVQRGRTEYLAASMVKVYPDLATANSAAQAIRDRTSELVTAWRTANAAFLTAPTTAYNLPVPDPSIEAARIAAYRAATGARQAAETARDEAAAAHASCAAQGTALRAVQAVLLADVAFLQTAKDVVTGIGATASYVATPSTDSTITITITDRVRDFVRQTGAYSGDTRSYESLLLNKAAQLNSFRTQLAAQDASCSALADALSDAQRTVDRARSDENRALTDVVAVCPTFTP